MLIAYSIAETINPALLQWHTLSTMDVLCALGYTYQLYFDFSGYSDMAVGLGRCLASGCENFNSPYKAVDISDFWERWHLSSMQYSAITSTFPWAEAGRGLEDDSKPTTL